MSRHAIDEDSRRVLGITLKNLKEAHNLTAPDIVRHLTQGGIAHFHFSNLTRWHTGKSLPQPIQLGGLIQLYGAELQDLCDRLRAPYTFPSPGVRPLSARPSVPAQTTIADDAPLHLQQAAVRSGMEVVPAQPDMALSPPNGEDLPLGSNSVERLMSSSTVAVAEIMSARWSTTPKYLTGEVSSREMVEEFVKTLSKVQDDIEQALHSAAQGEPPTQ